jgi:hypothetical protein
MQNSFGASPLNMGLSWNASRENVLGMGRPAETGALDVTHAFGDSAGNTIGSPTSTIINANFFKI